MHGGTIFMKTITMDLPSASSKTRPTAVVVVTEVEAVDLTKMRFCEDKVMNT